MTQKKATFYPEDQAKQMTETFVEVAQCLNGISPQQALEVLAKAAGRLIASHFQDDENRTKAYTRFGQATEAYLVDYLPYVEGMRQFNAAQPTADTIKN